MKRKNFLKYVGLLTGATIVAGEIPVFSNGISPKKIKGSVRAGGKGLKGVVVSDGFNVIITDAKGKYELDPHAEAECVFISVPPGYTFPNENGVVRHYHVLNGSNKFNFELHPLDRDDNDHHFIIWADPQVKNEKDVEKLMSESVPDVRKFVSARGKETLIHGITVGDIVWDELKLFKDYINAVGKTGIPFFQCLGNHDMDYEIGGDDASDNTFRKNFGPTYYSFNRGKVHYVVMDDVRYLGKGREYDGYISQKQLDWLAKDLAFVPDDHLIVLCVHIPIHNGVKNNGQLYSILADRKVHIMSGHTHYHRNVITGNIYEHNHGTVCGAWWTGPICGDGTPCGYGIYKVSGTEISWHYKSTGMQADHQMKLYVEESGEQNKLLVNIWDFDPEWKTEYFVDGVSQGPLQQSTGFDPLAYSTLLGPELPKPRGFAEPRKTEHLFQAKIPLATKEIKVEATNRFGKKFYASKNLS